MSVDLLEGVTPRVFEQSSSGRQRADPVPSASNFSGGWAGRTRARARPEVVRQSQVLGRGDAQREIAREWAGAEGPIEGAGSDQAPEAAAVDTAGASMAARMHGPAR